MDGKVSDWFSRKELECRCGCGEYIHNKELLDVLDDVRVHFGVPVTVNSGTRCKTHNKEIGGATNSQHVLGTAADIMVKGIEPKSVVEYLDSKYENKYGIGLYKSFTHIDVRDSKARWYG